MAGRKYVNNIPKEMWQRNYVLIKKIKILDFNKIKVITLDSYPWMLYNAVDNLLERYY